MNILLKRLANGETPPIRDFIEAWGSKLKLLTELENTPQEPEWHEEGNVRIHTDLVLQNIYEILGKEAKHLSLEDKLALIVGAALHDIGKHLVTKTKEIEGIQKIVSPRHEERGCAYLAYRLLELEIPYPIVQKVLRLVGNHHMPRHLAKRNSPKEAYFKLARMVDLELLYYLAKADMKGRISKSLQGQNDLIDLFQLFCQEYQVWQCEDPYHEWKKFFDTALSSLPQESRDAVLGYAIQDFEAGLIFTPEEAIARRYPYLKSFPQLVIMCGPSGSGKSTWIEKHLHGYQKISLDDLREEYSKGRSHQEDNSFIMAKAKEKLKDHLRNHEKVVWDATNIRNDFRRMICQLGYDYHALVTLVVMHFSETEIYRNNGNRKFEVSRNVLESQLDRLEWVDEAEAHRIVFVNQTSSESFN